MAVKIGINGFGRIGRMVARAMAMRKNEFEVAAINDVGSSPKVHAHLFKYDTVHGFWHGEVGHTDNALIVDGRQIKVFGEKDPSKLPWKSLGVSVVIEATGVFTARRDQAKGKAGYDDHITAGARKVILSARPRTPSTRPSSSASTTRPSVPSTPSSATVVALPIASPRSSKCWPTIRRCSAKTSPA